ncbi:DUF2877 domain-containing protein [Knoellia sp. 3-2P3]|uniref:DUF2877 domain-containing protein n=1 Tax=unclassified Knoellia TaxID=2618719 RepID=UPI0023DA5FFF|nr:DUF2877 domain-containing protein [Knoellia sp. 3-2P3]MDF2093898.1 DUF2877 domain-containing protein [Knoellia sp. 3-2P3]
MSPLLAEAVQAAPRPARVLAAFPTALYLHLDSLADEPRRPAAEPRVRQVLPVLTRDALRLPTGLRLGEPAASVAWGVEQGADVVVGAGRVRLPGADVVAVRTWRPTRVPNPASPVQQAALASGLDALEATTGGVVLRDLARDLTVAALAAADPSLPTSPAGARVRQLVSSLVGAGDGLTPSGDDALCGVVLALRAAGAPAEARSALAAEVDRALPATTSLSGSLLHAALEGYAVPEVVALVGALGRGDLGTVARVLPGVLAIGHSSGADLLAGAAGALEALAGAVPGPTDLSLSDSTPTTSHPQPEGARRV